MHHEAVRWVIREDIDRLDAMLRIEHDATRRRMMEHDRAAKTRQLTHLDESQRRAGVTRQAS